MALGNQIEYEVSSFWSFLCLKLSCATVSIREGKSSKPKPFFSRDQDAAIQWQDSDCCPCLQPLGAIQPPLICSGPKLHVPSPHQPYHIQHIVRHPCWPEKQLHMVTLSCKAWPGCKTPGRLRFVLMSINAGHTVYSAATRMKTGMPFLAQVSCF